MPNDAKQAPLDDRQQQDAPATERPVPPEERRREETPADKPSQAEGERE